jgi:sialate O-acetylesterase
MVLQQEKPAAIWGWAEPGEKVAVEISGNKGEATADGDGKWLAKVTPPAAGGPYELTVTGKNTVKLSDVLVGEVWICSGQSNMQWTVSQALNPEEEAKQANFPQIRHLQVARNPSQEPLADLEGAGQEEWQVCNPDTVSKFTAVGYYFGRALHQDLKVPIGLVNSSWGGTICEAWTSKPGLESKPEFKPILDRDAQFRPGNPNQAAALYNGMIHPLLSLSFRGAIWYQGESNLRRAEQYAELFPSMIQDWRAKFGQGEFPFLFVQLAPFRYNGQDPRNCAELWEAQLRTLKKVPNTGMAVTTDIGNVKDIHPKNKQQVGRRLSLWALAKTYGKEVVFSGPLYESHEVDGNKIRIRFQHVGGGLVAKEEKPLTHFEIAGADEKFEPATATIDGETIVVSSDKVEKPVAVRFAWTDTAEPNLFNQEGLPASPFRTDTFKLVTAGNVQ